VRNLFRTGANLPLMDRDISCAGCLRANPKSNTAGLIPLLALEFRL